MRCATCGFDFFEGTCPACGHTPHGASTDKPHPSTKTPSFFLRAFLPSLTLLVLLVAPVGAYVMLPETAYRHSAGEVRAAQGATTPQAQLGSQEGVPSASATDSTEKVQSRISPPLNSKKAYVAWMLARCDETEESLSNKWERAQRLMNSGELKDPEVVKAFLWSPREIFARSYNYKKAYDNTAIPIGHGQTISGPKMVTLMTQGLEPKRRERILEIGTGSGYQSSVLAELCDEVYTIEIVTPLFEETQEIYRSLAKRYPEYAYVHRKNADGYNGWIEVAPFQKIIVTAGIDHVPPPLLRQLAPGGIMVIPVGPPSGQTMLKIVKKALPGGGFSFERSDLFKGRKVVFVPFTATGGSKHTLGDSSTGSN